MTHGCFDPRSDGPIKNVYFGDRGLWMKIPPLESTIDFAIRREDNGATLYEVDGEMVLDVRENGEPKYF